MWLDDAGVAHTVALPDPTDVMADEFRAGLDTLLATDREAVRDAVEQRQDRLLAAGWADLDTPADLVGAAPPEGLLRGAVSTVRHVEAALDGVSLQWQLDVLLALDDYLD